MSTIKAMRTAKFERDLGGKIDGLLAAGYETHRRPTKLSKKKSFAPSALGWGNGKCPRYWQYMFAGQVVQDDNNALSIATMDNGTAAHKRLQEALIASGVDVITECKITQDDPPIMGYIDAILENFEDYGDVPLELKTTRMESFEHRRVTGQPADYHLIQLLIYMKLMGAKFGAVVYENRNDQSVLTLPVTMSDKNEKLVNGWLDWMRKTYDAIQKEVQIARPVNRRNARLCKDCPVKDLCWSQSGDGLELPTLM